MAGNQGEPSELPVGELFSRYLARQTLAKPSSVRIGNAWKHLRHFFGHIRPEAITVELCLQYRDERCRAGASIGTVSSELTWLRASLKFAYRNHWIDTEPQILVPRPPPPKPQQRLTIVQMRRLLAAALMPHIRLFIALTILTQMRPRDLLALKWRDVDLRRCSIEFRDARGRINTKKINPASRKWLERAYEVSKSDFVIEWGNQRVVEIKRGFQMTAKRAGLNCTTMTLYRSAVDLAAKSLPSIGSLVELEDALAMSAQSIWWSEDDVEVIKNVCKPSQGK